MPDASPTFNRLRNGLNPACRLSFGLSRSNGCPLDREEDCDLCGVEAFEKWHCADEIDDGIEILCPPEGCSTECARNSLRSSEVTNG